MPAVGDQHLSGARMVPTNMGNVTDNPFEPAENRLNEYTAQQIATLQSRLDKRLGPEYISSRQGPGGQRVHYLAAEKCINLANEVFGFNGWSSSIRNIQIDFVDENPNTAKISLGLSVIMRVTLKDGTYHEDIGYGHCENSKSKALAFEKAKKEGTTDGLKRALRTFGNVLGNCVYDKDYLGKVTKMKAGPSKWDVGELHRDADHTTVKENNHISNPGPNQSNTASTGLPPRLPNPPATKADESFPLDLEGEFGSDLFDEADFAESHGFDPDESTLIDPGPAQPQQNPPQASTISHEPQKSFPKPAPRPINQIVTPSKPERSWAAGPPIGAQPDLPPIQGEKLNRSAIPQNPSNNYNPADFKTPSAPKPQQLPRNDAKPIPLQQSNHVPNLPPPLPSDQLKAKTDSSSKGDEITSPTKAPSPLSSQIPEDKRPQDAAGGFYSARAADALRTNPYAAPGTAPTFDPRFDSPSIRKTAGINHNTSAPVPRNIVGINPPQFTDNNAGPVPSASQTQTHPDPARRGPTPGPVGGNNGFVPPTARGPMMASSYRPPTRKVMTRSNAANVPPATNATMNPVQAQNINGKRPPLADLTNARGSEDTANDPAKKSKVGDGNNVPNTTTTAQQ
ncbi:hypothetical protein AJ79_01778 [Helicocarpus griseus UAMH5409]|uniref:RAD52 homolog n=1 Tax=Helicocarpus griseus UAMH5409 TaxID=1447875 RepID=A0A2B7Y771_9EURO|nr:hypothetical protein AJ79_01778 [Helicocarpus griseus UAMH5409]